MEYNKILPKSSNFFLHFDCRGEDFRMMFKNLFPHEVSPVLIIPAKFKYTE